MFLLLVVEKASIFKHGSINLKKLSVLKGQSAKLLSDKYTLYFVQCCDKMIVHTSMISVFVNLCP